MFIIVENMHTIGMRLRAKIGILCLTTLAFVCVGKRSESNAEYREYCDLAPTNYDVCVTVVDECPVEEGKENFELKIFAVDKLFTYTDKKVMASDFTVQREIEKRRINETLDKKIELVDKCLERGASYERAMLTCFPLIKNTVDKVSEYVNIEPIDARVEYKNGKFSITKESSGRKLDEERFYASVYYSVKFFNGQKAVEAKTVVVEPTITYSQLKARLVLRSQYTTEYKNSTDDRAYNVAFAASKFDGLSIACGQTVSFNEVVGERSAENGFKAAKVIVDGNYVLGVGGGVCQASTAIYNAAIVAGLNAVVNAHSICPSYCEPGLDAMISSFSDLLIKNNTQSTVYFSVVNNGRKTTVKIFGSPNEYRIEPQSVVESVIAYEKTESVDTERKYFDSSSVSGDRLIVSYGKDGYISSTYLNYFDKNGTLVKRIKVRENEYKPSPQITVIAP